MKTYIFVEKQERKKKTERRKKKKKTNKKNAEKTNSSSASPAPRTNEPMKKTIRKSSDPLTDQPIYRT
jgi:hypothetical protein